MKLKNKKFLSLISSITLVSTPFLVVACASEINRYQAALPNDLQNRILFEFVGVNYNVNAKSQFSSAFKQGIDYIKKEVEGIMAQQEFFNIFTTKLHYGEEQANLLFTRIRDTLGLNLLANAYFSAVNNGENFDAQVGNTTIFQTESWHQSGTTKLNYEASSFYGLEENNPDKLFNPETLYENLNDSTFDDKIKEVAKHDEDLRGDENHNYNDEMEVLTRDNLIWANETNQEHLPPELGNESPTAVKDYQKKLERFKWWLRFRYQQYYYSSILPQLNETLFTMATIFDLILKITNYQGDSTPIVNIEWTKYANQLQDFSPNRAWETKYRWVWDYTIGANSANNIDRDWENNPLPDLMKDSTELNFDFLNLLASAAENPVKNSVDPVMGINGFVSDTNGKDYNSSINPANPTQSDWILNLENEHHFWNKDNKGTFVYSAPVYFIDAVLNLNFSYYNKDQNNNQLTPDIIINNDTGLATTWKNSVNSNISGSAFSQYMRAENLTSDSENYDSMQELKWNTLWQMIYFLASQADTNPNSEVARDNFNTVAKVLFPKYIKKNNIYNDDFWQAVSSYY